MQNEEKGEILFMALIAGRTQQDALLSALLEAGVHLINTIYGRGTVHAGYLKNILGLVPEKNKVAITCVLTGDKANAVLKMLTEKFHFDNPNTGIAFTVPIDEVSF